MRTASEKTYKGYEIQVVHNAPVWQAIMWGAAKLFCSASAMIQMPSLSTPAIRESVLRLRTRGRDARTIPFGYELDALQEAQCSH